MGKVLIHINLIVLPILFVLGCIRYFFLGMSGNMLPEYSEWLGWFSTFPDISAEIQTAWTRVNSANDGFCIPVWIDLFDGSMPCLEVGGTDAFLNFFEVVWIIISAPFRVIGWFFINFFGIPA